MAEIPDAPELYYVDDAFVQGALNEGIHRRVSRSPSHDLDIGGFKDASGDV